ncbi:hypothetical protein HDU82_000169 [Entophlyctis luteolus]|nr:hypothetical protein HDU82_000169 [Entophlyctis luteolus]
MPPPQRHPFEVFETSIIARLHGRARCPTASCASAALSSTGGGGVSNQFGARLVQMQCAVCKRRCRLRAALHAGGSACSDLLREYEAKFEDCRNSRSLGPNKRPRESPSASPTPDANRSGSSLQPTLFSVWGAAAGGLGQGQTGSAVSGSSSSDSPDLPPIAAAATASSEATVTTAAPVATAVTAASAAPSAPGPAGATPATGTIPAVGNPPSATFQFVAPVRSPLEQELLDRAIRAERRADAMERALQTLQARLDQLLALLPMQSIAAPPSDVPRAPPVPPRPPAPAPRADPRRAPSVGRGAHRGSSRPPTSRNISQVGFSTAAVAVPNAVAAAAATAAAAPGATATTAPAPANEETFATVARRAHNRRKLVPPPPPPKPQPPLTRQQYDAKVHTARARSANKMVKPLLPPKKFAVVRVALHSNRQLRACQGRDRAGLLNALCTELGIRKYVALVSTIGNSILEVYCTQDDLHVVVSTLINREQKVLPSSFNPLAIGHDGQLFTDEGSKQVARCLAHLCNRASTVNLRDAILMGASERVKELTREFFDKIKQSPNATIDGRSRINVARQAHASNVDQWLNEARASFEREQQADAEFLQRMEHHEEEDAAAEAPLDRAMEEVISSESGPSTEGAARLDN